jgi:multimeric flavodoxin WrbA
MEYLKDILEKEGHDVELSSVRDADPRSIPAADLYVFSSPTQIGSPARKMKKFLKKVRFPKQGAKYALVTTHLDPKAKTLEKMETLLTQKEATKVTDGLKIQVSGMKGPCENGHEEKLEKFAKQITA